MEKLHGIDTLKGRVPQSHALRDKPNGAAKGVFLRGEHGQKKSSIGLFGRKATDEHESHLHGM